MMMRAPSIVCRRFVASKRGVAAVEFAIVMPVLLIMFLASFDAGNAIALYMKVRSATFTLAAVTNQYGTGGNAISATDMTAITGATSAVLSPFSNTPTVIVISQIKATSATNAVVSWSYTVNGSALTPGAPYNSLPTNFASNSCGGSYPCYAILATVSYSYTPVFGAFLTGPINFTDSLYVTPRSAVCIQYNSVPSSC
ncbi:MAG TPA: TadE/TadG family type IV pilus assembly protein [Xanthobacteraceae bacterium]|nr:TadE/TadG family type IV pilus assembly protein [Xanthobacteraceae bacterium]